jgi:hypothetical protein
MPRRTQVSPRNGARETIESWRIDYNQMRLQSALGFLTPEEFAIGCANFPAKRKPGRTHLGGLSEGAAQFIAILQAHTIGFQNGTTTFTYIYSHLKVNFVLLQL